MIAPLSSGGVLLGGGVTSDPHHSTVVDRFHPHLPPTETQLIPHDAHGDMVLAIGGLIPVTGGILVLTQANFVSGPNVEGRGHTWSKGFFELNPDGAMLSPTSHRETPFKISSRNLDRGWATVGKAIVLITGEGGACAYNPSQQRWSEVASKNSIVGFVQVAQDRALMLGRDGKLWMLAFSSEEV
jgi:hypothetical protein